MPQPKRTAAPAASFADTLTRAQPAATQTIATVSTPSLRDLFATPVTPSTAPKSTPAADPSSVPTLQSMFGTNPWQDNPQGRDPNGNPFTFNRIYFATQQTAEKVAQMCGGRVVLQNAILTSGPITQSQPNFMVQLPNGSFINPGLVASFYTHGYPQSYIDRLLNNEFGGISA